MGNRTNELCSLRRLKGEVFDSRILKKGEWVVVLVPEAACCCLLRWRLMTLNSNYCETAVWGVGLAAGWSRFLKNRQFLKKSVGDELNLEPVNYNFELFTSGCRWMRWNKGKDNNSRNELKSRLGILWTDCSFSSSSDTSSNCSVSLWLGKL